jgi:DNA replication and repair protein RecF
VDVAGFAEDAVKAGAAATAVEALLREAFAGGRRQDAAAGRTLVGTHRSALKVIHILKNMQAEHCSMGEQKAMLLSIILAQARAGARWHGVTPLLLLDEVAGHLDAVKRLELFEEICDTRAQVWMTGTEPQLFAGIQGKAQFFSVQNGNIEA